MLKSYKCNLRNCHSFLFPNYNVINFRFNEPFCIKILLSDSLAPLIQELDEVMLIKIEFNHYNSHQSVKLLWIILVLDHIH